MIDWQEKAKKLRAEAHRWIALGAADERENLLDILLNDRSITEVAHVVDLLNRRQRESGVQVHRCGVADMEPK